MKDGEWMQALFREALAQCAQTAPMGGQDAPKETLKTVRAALSQLSPNDKILILLRDQCHFSFEVVGTIVGVSAHLLGIGRKR